MKQSPTSRPPEAVGPARAGGLLAWRLSQQVLGVAAVAFLGFAALWSLSALGVRWLWPQQRGMEPGSCLAHRPGPVGADRRALGIDRWIALPARRLGHPDPPSTTAIASLPAIGDVGSAPANGTVAYGAAITLLFASFWPLHAMPSRARGAW